MTQSPVSTDLALGRRAMALLDQLAQYSDEPSCLTRLYLSKAHRRAAEATLGFMQNAGLDSHIDPLGSVVGRLDGANPDAPALLIGSHIDTVVDAGRYDGTLGVVLGIVTIEALRQQGVVPACPIEIVAFGDEENARFPTNLSTSAALSGRYDPAWLDGIDQDGITLRDALAAFGGDPSRIGTIARDRARYRGYLEVHIEQGPQLEAAGFAVGIVSAISGISRARAAVTGEAGHAGTVPMPMRRDALAAAAEMIVAVERTGAIRLDTVATVGATQVRPGAINVIPARVDFTLDARSPDDVVRHAMVRDIMTECEAIAQKRGVGLAIEPFMDSPATPMDSALIAVFEHTLRSLGISPMSVASGAGHDAVAMAGLCPSAMLFVRCKGGISHNPAESITVEDADIAARVLIESVKKLVT
ncbi:allantoate amidohydrolase [Microvirga brassicacearum]|uniref:Allantoate amidohydrolase n=1 Tax=Microvirga brassicacearum TaxID=2580413 RepID=A0A5N3PG44_9HYPH|nr:allantoate amidohydrolase [Microvirga brassicacearum]KAB0268690.1 allantoate amidohydrolase [Microvirga brassicacearum]